MNPSSNIVEDPFLFINEAAEVLRVDTKTVRRWIESGKLQARKHGSQWIIFTSEIKSYFERLKK